MERLLNVFTIVKFPNDACNSTGGNYYGTCYTATECTALGNIINIVSLFLKVQNVVTHYVTLQVGQPPGRVPVGSGCAAP